MPLYTFIHSLLIVLVQSANKTGLQTKHATIPTCEQRTSFYKLLCYESTALFFVNRREVRAIYSNNILIACLLLYSTTSVQVLNIQSISVEMLHYTNITITITHCRVQYIHMHVFLKTSCLKMYYLAPRATSTLSIIGSRVN
jgi:hypothetical protein